MALSALSIHLRQRSCCSLVFVDYIRIGQQIRKARETSGKTLREVSSLSGFSHSMIGLLEQGRSGDVKLGTLEDIAKSLGAKVFVEIVPEGSPDPVILPAGVDPAAQRILRALLDAEPEDVDVAVRWLERSAAVRQQRNAG